MSDDDMEQKVDVLVQASRVESDTAHDNILDAIHEKDFITFLQLKDEQSVTRDDALGICDLWSGFRSMKDVISCKQRVNATFDNYERDYVKILNTLCR